MTFLEKLDFLMVREDMNRSTLSQCSRIPYTTIDNWYKRGYEGVKLSTLKKLADFFGTTLDYLIREEITDPDHNKTEGFQVDVPEMRHLKKYRVLDVHGRQVVDSALTLEYERMTRHDDATVEHRDNITYINCYDLAVSAGIGEPLGETYYKTRLEIPTERVPESAHFCLRVNGDSMEPAYHDGDIVFVQRLEGSVSEGEIGVFYLNGEGYLKRLGRHALISLNSAYSPIPLHDFDSLSCQGRVLGKI